MSAPISMKAIIAQVAAAHGLTVEQIHSPRSSHRLVQARWEAFATIYATGAFTMPQIARAFGLHCSTVSHGVHAYAARTPGYVWPARRPVTLPILDVLEQGPATIASILRATGISGEIVSSTLARLVRQGVVMRQSHRPVVWALAEAA